MLPEERPNIIEEAAGIWTDLEGTSDHRAVFVRLTVSVSILQRRKKAPAMRGWQPHLDEHGEPAEFHALLTEGLAQRHCTVMEVNAIVVKAARASGESALTPKRQR
eukprot:1902559-Pyramimonas_sp.AAC.1